MTFTRHRSGRIAAAALVAAAVVALPTAAPAVNTSTRLAGLWLADEGAGQTVFDYSFSGNKGVLGSTTAAESSDPAWIRLPSYFGWLRHSALRFDGNDHVKVADAPSLEPDGITLAARIRSTGPGYFRYVAAKGALDCEVASYGLYTGAQGGLRFYVSDGADATLSEDAGIAIWDGQWHTVVGDYNGTSVRLYVDGKLVGTPTPADVTVGYGLPDDDLYLGNYIGDCGREVGFAGDIDGALLVGRSAGAQAGGTLPR